MIKNIPGTFRTFKYVLDVLTIVINDEIIEIDPKFVNSISLEKDFDNDSFPVFSIDFNMDDDVYYKILSNKDNVQFKVRMMKYLYDDRLKIRAKKQVINNIFISFISEDPPQLDKKLKKSAGDDSLLIANKSLRLFLFNKDDLVNTKNYINTIFSDVTMLEAVTYCLASSGIKKVLLAPFNNVSKYNEIRIPPLTLIDAFDYLENVYDGFYNNGSILFYDFDCMYFLDKAKNNNVYRNNEHTQNIISILDPTTTQSLVSGCNLDDDNKKTYINIPPTAITHSSVSILNEHLNGNNAIVISPTTGKVTKVELPVKQITGNVYKLLLDRYNNNRAISNFKSLSLENDSIVNIAVQGVDINSFTPNKQFQLIFEDSITNRTLGGSYRLSRVGFIFKKEAAEFTIMGNAELKKIR